MKKKYKLILLGLIIVLLMFLLFKNCFSSRKSYKIKSDKKVFIVSENKNNTKYYIEIKYTDKVYPLNINYNSKKNKLIKKIYYYEDNTYECVLPILSNNSYIDMMCYKDNIIYNYSSINGVDKKLDKFVKSLDIYDINKYNDNKKETSVIDETKFYNIIDKNTYITNYRGIIYRNNKIELFNNDVYNKPLSTFVSNYYIVANYNSDNKYEFNEFYIVNLDTYEVSTLKYKDTISFDSYIQGIVDNKVYIYDVDNENQYEIDIDSKKISLISSSRVKYYNYGKWESISKSKANNILYFNFESLDNIFDCDFVYETIDSYYLIKKNDNYYDLYLVYKNNKNLTKYLTTIENNNINIGDNYIYYVYKDKIYYYSEETNKKLLLSYSELEYNDDIKFYIY